MRSSAYVNAVLKFLYVGCEVGGHTRNVDSVDLKTHATSSLITLDGKK